MKNSEFRPSVRYINGIEIYFKSKTAIQVRENSTSVDIIRWDKPGGGRYTAAWRPFCRKLYCLNSLGSIYQIIRIADRYNLRVIGNRHPSQPPPDIFVRPSKYIWKKKGNHGNI